MKKILIGIFIVLMLLLPVVNAVNIGSTTKNTSYSNNPPNFLDFEISSVRRSFNILNPGWYVTLHWWGYDEDGHRMRYDYKPGSDYGPYEWMESNSGYLYSTYYYEVIFLPFDRYSQFNGKFIEFDGRVVDELGLSSNR